MAMRRDANIIPTTDNPLESVDEIPSEEETINHFDSGTITSDNNSHSQNKDLPPPSASSGTFGSHRQSSSIESVTSIRSGRSARSWSIDTQSSLGAGSSSDQPLQQEMPKQSVMRPVRKKRMSMNIALPVVASSSSHSPSSSLSSPPEHAAATGATSNNGTPNSAGSSSSELSATSLGRSQSMRHMPKSHHAHHSLGSAPSAPSNTISSFTPRRRTASHAAETYLSQLAARERRVVELRDELKRVQDELKRAESDLKQFRNEASFALSPTAISSANLPSSSLSSPSNSLEPTAGSPPKASSSPSLAVPPAAAVRQFPASKPSFPPPDDVLNMGRRVMEELGSQFRGLFEDIRNVTIGEDPWVNRDSSTSSGQKSSEPDQEMQAHPQSRLTSSAAAASTSNSYYIL